MNNCYFLRGKCINLACYVINTRCSLLKKEASSFSRCRRNYMQLANTDHHLSGLLGVLSMILSSPELVLSFTFTDFLASPYCVHRLLTSLSRCCCRNSRSLKAYLTQAVHPDVVAFAKCQICFVPVDFIRQDPFRVCPFGLYTAQHSPARSRLRWSFRTRRAPFANPSTVEIAIFAPNSVLTDALPRLMASTKATHWQFDDRPDWSLTSTSCCCSWSWSVRDRFQCKG